MAKTLGEFALNLGGLAVNLPGDMEKATNKAALHVTTTARGAIARDSGGDSQLSGLRGKSKKVGARYDMSKAGTHGKSASAIVYATGPLHLLESDTRRHQIIPKVKKGRSTKSKAGYAQRQAFYNAIFGGGGGFAGVKPLAFKGGGFSYRASHPGTKGKKTWSRAIDRATPRVSAIYQDALASSMTRRLLK